MMLRYVEAGSSRSRKPLRNLSAGHHLAAGWTHKTFWTLRGMDWLAWSVAAFIKVVATTPNVPVYLPICIARITFDKKNMKHLYIIYISYNLYRGPRHENQDNSTSSFRRKVVAKCCMLLLRFDRVQHAGAVFWSFCCAQHDTTQHFSYLSTLIYPTFKRLISCGIEFVHQTKTNTLCLGSDSWRIAHAKKWHN